MALTNGGDDSGSQLFRHRPKDQLPTVRSKLLMVVLACLLPSLAGVGLLISHFYERERAQLERNAIQTTRILSAAVDRDLSIGGNVARALATSHYIVINDLAGFHREAKSLLQDDFPGFNFVLSDETGQQIVNTSRPFGEPLPHHGNPDQLRRVFESGRPVISDLYIGGVMKRPLISIDVPVWRDSKVIYDLSVGFLPERLGRILTEQGLPPDRIVAVFDTQGVTVARTRSPEQFVGRKGTADLIQQIQKSTEGVIESVTLEGIPVITAFHRSATTGWAVGMGTPRARILTELLHTVSFITVIVIVLFAFGFATAWVLGGRIGRAVKALTDPVLALGQGRPVIISPCYFREAVDVTGALKTVESNLNHYRDSSNRYYEELKSACTRAELANEAKTRFLASVSHDLRQPLQAQRFQLFNVARYANTPDQVNACALMEKTLEATELMLSRLMDFASLESGNVAVRREVFRFDRLVWDIIHQNDDEATAKGLAIGARLLPCWTDSDPILLGRIVRNLITNALRYTDRGGILVGIRRRGGNLHLEVYDTGKGIPSDQQQVIFEEFRQLDNPERNRTKGYGLGLAIVAKTAELLGHRLFVRSVVGRGSVFAIEVPKVNEPDQITLSEIPEAGNMGGAASILLIEDDKVQANALVAILTGYGYNVTVAHDATTAIATQTHPPDIIVSDYRLPGHQTGVDTVVSIRQRFARSIPAIIVTGDTQAKITLEAAKADCDILIKPFTPAALMSSIARTLLLGNQKTMDG